VRIGRRAVARRLVDRARGLEADERAQPRRGGTGARVGVARRGDGCEPLGARGEPVDRREVARADAPLDVGLERRGRRLATALHAALDIGEHDRPRGLAHLAGELQPLGPHRGP
jgi:hypothetical protein